MALIERDARDEIGQLHAAGELDDLLRSHEPEDKARRTPLMLAYWWGHSLAASALVQAGAVYEQTDAQGNNAAWYARRFGKGARQREMEQVIDSAERRISMEKILDRHQEAAEPAERRLSARQRRNSM